MTEPVKIYPTAPLGVPGRWPRVEHGVPTIFVETYDADPYPYFLGPRPSADVVATADKWLTYTCPRCATVKKRSLVLGEWIRFDTGHHCFASADAPAPRRRPLFWRIRAWLRGGH